MLLMVLSCTSTVATNDIRRFTEATQQKLAADRAWHENLLSVLQPDSKTVLEMSTSTKRNPRKAQAMSRNRKLHTTTESSGRGIRIHAPGLGISFLTTSTHVIIIVYNGNYNQSR